LPPSMRDQVGPEAAVCLPAGFLAAEECGIVRVALQCGCGRGAMRNNSTDVSVRRL
jgi:hypothetical protein